MPIKFASIVYLPPKRLYPTDSFMQNMRNFPTKHPLIMFTDEYESTGPEKIIKLSGKVEIAKDAKNKMAVNNLIFYTAMRIAASHGLTHVLLLENDCRVGAKHWDDTILQEFLSKNCDAVTGGSMVVFNPSCYNREAAQAFERFLTKTLPTRICPLSITGSSNLAEKRDTALFPNGAFAIYKLDWLLKAYPEIIGQGTTVQLAKSTRTWDYAVADKLWSQFKEGAYDKVVHIDSIYSGYGNIMTTEDERKQWLIDGRIVGVHQIKSDWIGPEPNKEKAVEVPVTGSVELFIVTYAKDFPYLRYCLRSIKKFATGFSGVTILVPTQHVKELRALIAEVGIGGVTVKSGYEWAKKGNMWHVAQELRADEWCSKADYIAHFDADCLFDKPVTPAAFFNNGKPLLRYEPFESLAKRHPGTWNWKIAGDLAFEFSVADEYMRGHPEVYHRALYAKTRELIEKKVKQPINEYVKSCRNEYPSQVCEYEFLGAVAHKFFAEQYSLVDLSKEPNPDYSPFPVIQLWSHGPIDKEQTVWINGAKKAIIPAILAEEILK